MTRRKSPAAADASTRTIAYIRVSTDKQADHGVSLEAQESKVRAYAALYDLELMGVEVDAGESASTLDRPALQRALSALRTGRADALLVVKLDRLTRSVRDLAALLEGPLRKRALLSISEQVDTRSASGRMVLNVLTSIGQWEREAIGERTSAAMSHMRDEGRYTGGVAPYGYTLEAGQLVVLATEQDILARARALGRAGLSLRAIASTLEEAGYRSRSGRGFAPSAIARMLECES